MLRYTAEDLVGDAAAQGAPVKQRLITDWVEKGLLDGPARHSLGRGRGSAPGTWPENQRKLFLLLLGKRQEVSRLATLCNVPVAFWLYFGPDYVPARQVRRALATYVGAYETASARAARQSARQLCKQLLPPRLSRKEQKRLSERLTDAIVSATSGGIVDYASLLSEAREGFDPNHEGRTVGPPGARLTPEAWVRTLEARLSVIGQIDTERERPSDERLEDVRLAHHQRLSDYLRKQPEFAKNPDVQSLFGTPTFEGLVNSACLDLLTVLGFLELSPGGGAAQPPV